MALSLRDREIIDHYSASIGEARRVFKNDRVSPLAPSPIIVMEFAPPSDECDWVYATVGASRLPMTYPDEGGEGQNEHRIELMILSNGRHDDLAELLTVLAAYPFELETFFDVGHIVAGSPGEGVVQGSPLTEILLAPVLFEGPEFEFIYHQDGTHTRILLVVPLYPLERAYAKERGYMALLELFAENETDTSDLQRSPVV